MNTSLSLALSFLKYSNPDKLCDISACEDYDLLTRRRETSSSGSSLEKAIEARMVELNHEELPVITDYDLLTRKWKTSSSGSSLRNQIEARMVRLVENVHEQHVPEFILKLWNDPGSIPGFLSLSLTALAQRVAASEE